MTTDEPKREPIWDLVIDDMRGRRSMGHQKYGTHLHAFNGRAALQDAYEEALDMAVYLRQALYEKERETQEGPTTEPKKICGVEYTPPDQTQEEWSRERAFGPGGDECPLAGDYHATIMLNQRAEVLLASFFLAEAGGDERIGRWRQDVIDYLYLYRKRGG